jgi:hypothetical protein
MKSICRFIFAVLFPILMVSCSTEEETAPTLFTVKVDSLQHPSSVALNDTIAVHLFGTIGGDGCHSFSHFQDTKQSLQVDLTVWGKRTPADVCPAVMVYLDGREYTVIASQRGMLYINVHQPDGSTLVDSVQVL